MGATAELEIAGYQVVRVLGSGANSTIYQVRGRDGKQYALKRVRKRTASDQRFLDQAIAEHNVAKHFDHPLLRRSYKLIKQRDLIRVTEVIAVMEFIEGKTLEQHHSFSMHELVVMCKDAATALDLMHQKGYVHADIKPNNIMVLDSRPDHGWIKLIDFGQSCKIGTQKDRIQGTPDYIAPEQVRRKSITPQTDIFNLGATLYWLLTEKHVPTLIPKGTPGQQLQDDLLRARPPHELNAEVPPALSSLVCDCIQTLPRDRPEGMGAVIDRLDIAAKQIERRDRDTVDLEPVRKDRRVTVRT